MTDRRTDRHTEMTKLIVAFSNFTNVPEIQREIIRGGCRSGFERLQVSRNNAITKEFAHIGVVRLLYGPQPHVVETICLVRHFPTRISNEQLVLGNCCYRFSYQNGTDFHSSATHHTRTSQKYIGLPWKVRVFSALQMQQSCLFMCPLT